MISQVCSYCKNYFLSNPSADILYASYTIQNGSLLAPAPPLLNGQYFRIVGSALNDGVYKYPATALKDETFDGAICVMSVPPAFADLVKDIETWVAANKSALASAYKSESFGGYSYTKEDGSTGALSWKDHFAAALQPYRRLSVL